MFLPSSLTSSSCDIGHMLSSASDASCMVSVVLRRLSLSPLGPQYRAAHVLCTHEQFGFSIFLMTLSGQLSSSLMS